MWTNNECKTIKKKIDKYNKNVKLIQSKDSEYNAGISIVPSYLAKGLEFDSVILFNVNDEKYKNTRVIVTSIFHDKETILNSGADLYLPKPYEVPQLIKWVELFIKEFNR